MKEEKKIFLNEEERLRRRLEMTHAERFYLLMRLIRLSRKLKNATIIEGKKQ